ncbi:MAG: hypothetical protein ACYC3S_07170 [Chloroflexota bacterium]
MENKLLQHLLNDWTEKEQRHREFLGQYFQTHRVVCGDTLQAPLVTPQIIEEIDRLEREAEEAHKAFLVEARRQHGA